MGSALELASRVPVRVEAALRFVPFLVSIAALLLFWDVARRYLSGAYLAGAVLLFGVAPPVIWYATSVKQYGVDIAGSILLVWLVLRHREEPESMRRALGAALGGGLVLLLSFPCVAIAALLGVVLVIETQRGRLPWRPVLLVGAGWGLGALLAVAAALRVRDPAAQSFLEEFWAEGFLPWSSPLQALLWVPRRIWATFAHFLVFYPPKSAPLAAIVGLPLVFALVGLAVAIRQREMTVALVLVPTLAAIALGAAHVLPFRHRVGVYAMWPILVLAFLGMQLVIERFPARKWLRALAFLPSAPFLLVALVDPPPYRGQATRPVLEAMHGRMQAGDALYVTCGGRHAIGFYGPRLGIEGWDQGTCPTGKGFGQLYPEVDRYAGSPRLWLFFTQSRGEAEALRERLASRGVLIEEVEDPYRNRGEEAAGALLFDLARAKP